MRAKILCVTWAYVCKKVKLSEMEKNFSFCIRYLWPYTLFSIFLKVDKFQVLNLLKQNIEGRKLKVIERKYHSLSATNSDI